MLVWRTEKEIRLRIAATASYARTLKDDDAERLQLEQQVELLRWVLGEVVTEELPAI